MIKLILIILCFVVISGGFVCFCIVKASTPYDKEQDDLEQIKALKELRIRSGRSTDVWYPPLPLIWLLHNYTS